ncbi:MAG: 50S ribosomal protein L25 [Clostridia bacterium]|jgi:large subunit ribosomal protein L25|nr:50S ribosomal protein L25 [Clostridia bacterium]
MKQAILQAEKRQEVGKGAVGRLRRRGMVPAVLYGADNLNLNLALPLRELNKFLASFGANALVKLSVAGDREYSTLLREVQRDAVKQEVIHLDFMEISMTEKLSTSVPIRITGEAKGVKEGGVIQYLLRELDIECLPADLPEAIMVDVGELGIGEQILVEDLILPEGVTALTEGDTQVVSVVAPRLEEEKGPEEEEAEVALEEDTGEKAGEEE